MTRECSGCGLRSCEGQCFLECEADYETDPREAERIAAEVAEQRERAKAFWAELIALRDADSMMGDPMGHLEPKRKVA